MKQSQYKKVLNIIKNKLKYYGFILNIQRFIYLSILFNCMACWAFIKISDDLGGLLGGATEKYILWKYGSIENLGLLDPIAKLNLVLNIDSFFVYLFYSLTVILIIYSQIYIIRSVSFRAYEVRRTGKLLDDIGFWITYTCLSLLCNNSLMQLFENDLYKIICVYITSCFIFHFLVKYKSYGYLIRRRTKLLKT